MPFNAVGVGQNHPSFCIDNETRTTGTILPSSLPRQGKVGSAVNTPNLGVSFWDSWIGEHWTHQAGNVTQWTSKICHVTQESSKKKPQKKKRSQRWSKETLTTESSGTPKPSSPSSSSQAPKASSSSSLFKGLPPTTGLRFFPDRPVSLLPFRMGVSSACPSRSRLRTMASSWKTGRRVWVLANWTYIYWIDFWVDHVDPS